MAEITLVAAALGKGWAVVVSDYEGPESQWGAGIQAGQAVLDGIRATQAFAPAGLPPGGPVGMMGYSGGGLATTWAAELAPGYAPELNIVGAAGGGVPADLGAVARQVDGGPAAGIYFGAMVGLSRAYPLDTLLNERGRVAAAHRGSPADTRRKAATATSIRRVHGAASASPSAATTASMARVRNRTCRATSRSSRPVNSS